MALLRRYDWPGNVREVQNVIRQAVLQTTGPVLLPDFLPESVRHVGDESAREEPGTASTGTLTQLINERLQSGSHQVYDEVIGRVESELVQQALRHTGGDKVAAVKLLGINPANLRSTAALELFDIDTGTASPAMDSLIQPGMTMDQIEKEAIRRALQQTDGRRTDTAQLLGMSVRTLQRKIKEYDLDV
jgi:two-component system nitrogen regulation response regulator GlnG